MVKRSIFLFVSAVLVFTLIPIQVSAQDEDTARVRIGYFAFDPKAVDTFVDGELASFSDSWAYIRWNEAPFPDFQFIRTTFTAPYVELPAGAHSFAFVPKGEDLESAILGPMDVVLEAGHMVVLAIVGHDDNFDLAISDETVALAGADPSDRLIFNFVHNLKDGPPVDYRTDNKLMFENLAYGNVATTIEPAGPAHLSITATGDPSIVFLDNPAEAIPGISNVAAFLGEYPGTPGEDYFMTYDWAYTGEITVQDGGVVAVDDEAAGTIEQTAQRVRYALTLEEDAVLNIFVRATEDRAPGSWGQGPFDPALTIYDAHGNLIFWNDELSLADNTLGTLNAFDAGLEGAPLAAGTYIVEVGGSADIIAGPYKLVIESAAAE